MPTDEHPSPLKRGDDSRKNWQTINQLNALLQPIASEVRRLSSAIIDLRMKPNLKEGGAGGGKVEQFRFKTMQDDTITCVRWDGTNEGETVIIAKPYLLRRTPFDGKIKTFVTERLPASLTVTYAYSSPTKRTATIGNGSQEVQFIIPRYVLDDVIYAAPCDGLNLGEVRYLDLNADGRAWAESAA